MKDKILKVVYDLVEIPSVSSEIDELEKIVAYINGYYADYKNVYIDIVHFNSKPSIIIKNFDGLEADIILNGHVDVVPPSEDGQFIVQEKEGKLWGRGTGDMKSGIAVMMVLMGEILESEFSDKKVSLIINTDEEVGGPDGAKEVADLGYTAKLGVLIPDSGDLDSIVIAEKGMIDIEVLFSGTSCHASRPWLGENAIDNAYKALEELRSKIQSGDLYESEGNWGTSLSMTKIESGTATNVIPDSATASFDVRFTDDHTIEEIYAQFESIITKYNGEIITSMSGAPIVGDENSKFVQSYIKAFTSSLGKKPNIVKEHGASDGRYFSAKGMPVILHRPTCENIHSKNEWVDIDAVIGVYEVYREFILGK